MTDRFLFLPPARCPRHWSQYKIESAIVSVNACNGIGTNSDPHPHKGAVLDETKWWPRQSENFDSRLSLLVKLVA